MSTDSKANDRDRQAAAPTAIASGGHDGESIDALRARLDRQTAVRSALNLRKRPERLFKTKEELLDMSDDEIADVVQEALDRQLDTSNNGAMSALSKFKRHADEIMAERQKTTRAALETAAVGEPELLPAPDSTGALDAGNDA